MTVGKTPLKGGRRKQPRIVTQFPVEARFKGEGGKPQILPGITSNLHEERVSCRLRQPIRATASYAYLSVVTDEKRCAVSGRIMWITSLGYECGVRPIDWKQFNFGCFKRCATSRSSNRRTFNLR